MSEDTSAAPAASETITTIEMPADTPASMTPSEAARVLRAARKPKEQPAESAEISDEPTEDTVEETDAAPQEEATGETQEADPEETPSIEPPRSWSKEARERWATLDPDTQNYLLERDRADSKAIRDAQNQAAQERQAMQAQVQAAEQERQQYAQALPILLQSLQAAQAGEFEDVRTMQDVERMASEDPFRYAKWDAKQKQIQAVQHELGQAQQRQQQEQSQNWESFAQKQDALFAEKAPEILDPDKGPKLTKAALETLKDVGFTDQDLKAFYGQGFLRDHRIQLLVLDAVKYRQIQVSKEKAKTAVKKDVPPVQRPGVAQGSSAERDVRLTNLEQKLNESGNVKDAVALWAARRKTSGRR